MRFRGLFRIFCIITILASPMVARAQPFGPVGLGAGSPLPLPLIMIMRRLDLTTDQQTKLHHIMETSFTEAQPLMKKLHDVHDQIADKLLSTGAVSASDIAPLQQQETAIHQRLDLQMLSTALQIRALLTPGQLAKAADLHHKIKSTLAQMESLIGEPPPMAPPAF